MSCQKIQLTIFNISGRLLNFVLYLVVANLYGASPETDWFFFVYAVAYFFIGILYYTTESALVPSWYQLPYDEHLSMFASGIRLAFYAFPIVAILILISGFVVAPLQSIHPPVSMTRALVICLVLALQPSLTFLSSFFSSYRQFKREYFLPTIHLTLRTIGVLFVLFLVPQQTIMFLAIAYLAGELIRLFVLQFGQLPTRRIFFSTRLSAKAFWAVYGQVAWMTLALLGTVINPVIDLAMVGNFRDGSVTLVEYAGKLRGMPVLALGGLMVYLLGEWAHQHYQGNLLEWKEINSSFIKMIFFCIPVVVVLMVLEKEWVPLVFFSKRFTTQDIQQLQQLLYLYFPGVIFWAGSMVLSRVILVIQQARIMAYVTIVAAGLNIVLNVLFLHWFGLVGVGLSTTIVDIFVCLMYYLLVKRFISKPHPFTRGNAK